jgi:hypothetical protein
MRVRESRAVKGRCDASHSEGIPGRIGEKPIYRLAKIAAETFLDSVCD